MRFVDTVNATTWLHQFEKQDSLLAQALLNRLVLISSSEFEKKLYELIEGVSNTFEGKIALFPIKPLRKEQEEPPFRERRERYNSSGKIGYILTNLERNNPRRYTVSPTVPSMLAKKVRHIVLVDDIIASGASIEKYWHNLIGKTVKSWISYKKCKLWVIAYAAHADAVSMLVEKINAIQRENVLCALEIISPPVFWNSRYEQLCLKYGRLTNKPKASLGYGMCRSNVVFQHGCPNNTPAILWVQGQRWKPLFPNRGIPASLQSLFGTDTKNIAIDSLFDSGQYKLAIKIVAALEEERLSERLLNLLIILGLLRRGVNVASLQKVTLMEKKEVDKIVKICRDAGFLDEIGKVTPFGIDVLNRYKKEILLGSDAPKVVVKGSDMYYPQTFLGCQRKI